jgi:hypothetical protein
LEHIYKINYGFGGVELAEWQAIQRLVRSGFTDLRVLGTMFAIVEGESGSYTRAFHCNVDRTLDADGKRDLIVRKEINGVECMHVNSVDLGFMQFNTDIPGAGIWLEMREEVVADFIKTMFAAEPWKADAQRSSERAYEMYLQRGFQPWYAYQPDEVHFQEKKRRAGKAIANYYLRTQVPRLPIDNGHFAEVIFRQFDSN